MRELLPLGSDHVVVLLEGVLEAQQLRGGEGGSDPFGLPGQSVVEQEALRTGLAACGRGGEERRPPRDLNKIYKR